MQDASGVQTFSYGKMGELIKNIHTFIVPNGDPYTFEMKWAYDSWNRIDSIYYPDGEEVNYDYNNAGQLISLDGTKGQNTFNYVDSIRYDKFGSRARIRYGNGTASKYTYDAQSRSLTNLKTWDAQDNLMQDIDYNYIANGNISGAANSAGSISALGGNANYYHAYDSLSRIVWSSGSFTDDNNNNYSYYQKMTYSASGNIIQKANQGTTLLSGISTSFNYTNNYQYAGGKPHAVSSIKDANNNTTHNMKWDANGNMTYLSQPSVSMSRSMCWDEENRLTVVRDPKQLSHYIYNAGGERVWKLTGGIERMSVNGKDYIDQAILSKTLYTNPYMILTDKEYTKHYYIESQRVATKLGGGMANNLVDPISGTLDAIAGDVNRIACDLMENLIRYSCTEKIAIEIKPQFDNMEELMNQDNDEIDQYFYHGDHLGSSSWITDASGNVNQHLQYMPFGEQFVDQRATGHDIRFKFTGKERDSETGFDYFGARYYDSDLSIWLSVDPMSDMYPSTSPFMYVRGNPVMLIDPNGMFDDGFKTDANGNLTWVDKTGGDDYDIIYSNNDDGTVNMDESKALCVEKGVIQNSTHSNNTTSNKQYSKYEFDSHDDGKRFFEFMSQNTDVEWSHTRFNKDNEELSVLTTTHETDFEAGVSDLLFTSSSYDEYTFVGQDHNHRDGYWYPSGSDQEILYGGVRYYKGDIKFVHELELCVPNSFTVRIYDIENNSYFKYNSKFYYNPRDLPVFEIKAEKKP